MDPNLAKSVLRLSFSSTTFVFNRLTMLCRFGILQSEYAFRRRATSSGFSAKEKGRFPSVKTCSHSLSLVMKPMRGRLLVSKKLLNGSKDDKDDKDDGASLMRFRDALRYLRQPFKCLIIPLVFLCESRLG